MENRLIHGECIEEMSKLDNHCVDMVCCDLPYGTTKNPWDIIIPFEPLWEQYNRIVKPNGALVFTTASPFDKMLAMSNFKNFRYEWIWHKNRATGHLNATKMPLRAHETVLVFYRKQPIYNPQFTTGHAPMNLVHEKDLPNLEQRNYNHANQKANYDRRTTRQPRSVLNVRVHDNIRSDKIHSTQKPIELMAYFIKTYTNEGDVVLDNVMGSGTTCAAARALRRKYIGIEKEEHYYNFAVDRVNNIKEGDLDNTELVAASFRDSRQTDRSHTKKRNTVSPTIISF